MGPKKRVASGQPAGREKRRRTEADPEVEDVVQRSDAEEDLQPEDHGVQAHDEVQDDAIVAAVNGGGEPKADEEEEDEFAEKYPNASPSLLRELKTLHALLPENLADVVDDPEHNRARPAATEVLHEQGMPLYELRHSLHLSKLCDNPDILAQHQKMDVSDRGVFPVRVPCPALSVLDVDWSDLPFGKPILVPHPDSSVHIESLFQGLTTGQAVREFRALLSEHTLAVGPV
jgi:hypothetical protein